MGVIALTGGVAAGKSTVSAILREQGAIVLDADVFARKAVAPGSAGLHAIAEAFGTGVILPSGELDRTALGALVFRDDNARATLNSIVHPEVRRLAARAIAQAGEENPDTVLVYDVPLLAEARDPGEFDLVVVVDAPAEVRIARLCTETWFDEGRGSCARQCASHRRKSVCRWQMWCLTHHTHSRRLKRQRQSSFTRWNSLA